MRMLRNRFFIQRGITHRHPPPPTPLPRLFLIICVAQYKISLFSTKCLCLVQEFLVSTQMSLFSTNFLVQFISLRLVQISLCSTKCFCLVQKFFVQYKCLCLVQMSLFSTTCLCLVQFLCLVQMVAQVLSHKDNKKVLSHKDNKKVLSYKGAGNN